MAEDSKIAGLGEDFASELSGYGDLVSQVGDTVVRSLLFLDPFGAFMQSFGIYILPFGVLVMLAFNGLRAPLDKAKSLGVMIMASSLSLILLMPVDSVSFSYSKAKQSKLDDNSRLGYSSVILSDQAFGTVYPLKGSLSFLSLFQSGFDEFRKNIDNGVATSQVYDFMNKKHLSGIDSEAGNKLTEITSLYLKFCTPVAINAVKDDHQSLSHFDLSVSNRDFQLIGLLGGVGLGDGYYLSQDIEDVTANAVNSHYLGSPGSANWGDPIVKEAYRRKSQATYALYLFGRDSAPEATDVSVYSYKYWRTVNPDKNDSNSDTDISPAKQTDPDISSPINNPFSKFVIRPEINLAEGDQEIINLIRAKSSPEATYLVKDCWTSYIAAEAAMTNYLDAVADNSSFRNSYFGTLLYNSREEQRKNIGGVTDAKSKNTQAMSSFTVRDAQTNIMAYAENPGDGSDGTFSASVKAMGYGIVSSFKELFKIFTVMGMLSVLIVGIMAIYLAGPLFFSLSPFLGIDIIWLWYKLLAVFIIALVFSILIINMGALVMYQVMSSHFANQHAYLGSPDINDNLLLSGIYMGTLTAVGIVEIAVAYIVIFKEGGALRTLSGEGAGMASSVGKVAIAAGLGAMKLAASALGVTPRNGGGGGGGGGGGDRTNNIGNEGNRPAPEAFKNATRPSLQLGNQPSVSIRPRQGNFIKGPNKQLLLPGPK